MDNILDASRIKINGVYTDEKGIYPKGRYEVPTPDEDIEIIYIKGRDGELTKKNGYRNISFIVRFYIHADSFKTAFRKAKPFILGAKTIQVDDDDEVYYKVKSLYIQPAENPMRTFGEFVVYFTLDPFQYETADSTRTITTRTTINNPGYESQPIITAQVAGTGRIYINGQEIVIQNINGSIIIDSELMNAYRNNQGIITNLNNHMVGDFPVLEHGNNVIDFDGDITKIEVNPRWRWV